MSTLSTIKLNSLQSVGLTQSSGQLAQFSPLRLLHAPLPHERDRNIEGAAERKELGTLDGPALAEGFEEGWGEEMDTLLTVGTEVRAKVAFMEGAKDGFELTDGSKLRLLVGTDENNVLGLCVRNMMGFGEGFIEGAWEVVG